MKLELIKYDNANCLEATWKEVITTIQDVEKEIEVDGVLTKELVKEEVQTEVQIACVAYADVQIDLLRVDALKYGTSLDEYEDLIAEVEAGIVLPTTEELLAYELDQKIQEANGYLAQTDWVNAYKIRHDLGLELIPEESSKWEVIRKREEYITFLKGI